MKKRSLLFILVIVTNCFLLIKVEAQSVIFLHHSTGGNVYSQGDVPEWIEDYNSDHGTNISITERAYPNSPWPWNNYPYDYWKLWVDGSCNSGSIGIECLNSLSSDYDLIVFKHCFPVSDILEDNGSPDITSSRKSIENFKLQYRALRTLMDSYQDTKFMVWTLAPRHRLATSSDRANRAHQFVEWVKNEWLTEDGEEHDNIFIFDFFGLVAEQDATPANGQQYCLKYDYERSHSGSDSHPNTQANETVGPIFAESIVNTVLNSNITVPVESISIQGQGGKTEITTDNGTLQLVETILPENATDPSVLWSVDNEEIATVNSSGLLTAHDNGTVTVTASARDGSGISGEIDIRILNQFIPVKEISVCTDICQTAITEDNGSLQMIVTVLPINATNKSVTWSVNNTDIASISSDGLLEALGNGSVIVTATANDGSNVYGNISVAINNQLILVEEIMVTAVGDQTAITENIGSIQMKVGVLPSDATDKTVSWSIDKKDIAVINKTGLLVAKNNGEVTVTATANDGSGVSGSMKITIKNQKVFVESIVVKSTGNQTFINKDNGTLQMFAEVLPNNAANKTISWEVDNEEIANITNEGLLIAIDNGTVLVKAAANDGSGISGTMKIDVYNQYIPVEDIFIKSEYNNERITENNGILKLYVSVFPENATSTTVDWFVEDSTLAKVDTSGTVYAVNNGTVMIKAVSHDNPMIYDSITIEISNQEITDINNKSRARLMVFPNPVCTGNLHIFLSSANIKSVSVFNMKGLKMKEEIVNNNINKVVFNISSLNTGPYILMVLTQNDVYWHQVIKR